MEDFSNEITEKLINEISKKIKRTVKRLKYVDKIVVYISNPKTKKVSRIDFDISEETKTL